MIYISSSCVQGATIRDSVVQLAEAGFRNIELSGGTELYPELAEDLIALREQYKLEFLCHNYFPPPARHFVLNLASLDQETYQSSMEQVRRAVDLSATIGAARYGFHAGFLIDIPLNQIGKKIERFDLFDRQKAMQQFCAAVRTLNGEQQKIKLYIENNVFSAPNAASYEGVNPFFLTDYAGFNELRSQLDFALLLDLAHLKVSARSLGHDFENQVQFLLPQSDYVHISDNDGTVDSNGGLEPDSEMYHVLERSDLRGKIFTLEVYRDLETVRRSYELLRNLLEV